MNTFGQIFRITTFGESHGPAIGGVIDGMPAGVEVDFDFIRQQLARRRPGQSDLTTSRQEPDEVELLSGIFEGRTTGTPIGFIVRNTNQHSSDYDNLRDIYRPSHADYTYQQKYGLRDHRGGGRSSARETISRVVAGAFAMLVLRQQGISIQAYTSQVGNIKLTKPYTDLDLSLTESNSVRCPDEDTACQMEELIRKVKAEGDTIGGTITCIIKGCPVGLGEPVFGKLHASLGNAMLSINACHGFEYGAGFDAIHERGSEQNDCWAANPDGDTPTLLSNNSGGIQGGISNGADIYFRCLFKPVATLLREQPTVDTQGNSAIVKARGRHDACVLPRAVPVVEAMAAITILDHLLMARSWFKG